MERAARQLLMLRAMQVVFRYLAATTPNLHLMGEAMERKSLCLEEVLPALEYLVQKPFLKPGKGYWCSYFRSVGGDSGCNILFKIDDWTYEELMPWFDLDTLFELAKSCKAFQELLMAIKLKIGFGSELNRWHNLKKKIHRFNVLRKSMLLSF